MRKSLFEEPSATTASPMLSLLPSLGEVSELERYSASFFARLEKVEAIRASAEDGEGEERDMQQSLDKEVDMLKVVLAWTSGRKEEG